MAAHHSAAGTGAPPPLRGPLQSGTALQPNPNPDLCAIKPNAKSWIFAWNTRHTFPSPAAPPCIAEWQKSAAIRKSNGNSCAWRRPWKPPNATAGNSA